ncbi:Sec63 Brl domain-containing protein [Thamnocephalis sphaerospora]|uniref:Sec63 Brl domain-containing protein n=1 Tax=Thamnocephalis sphaerospora TaxID=78915 RepID=A0A4P9XGX8_9FUNG|nr:Sec63 Brl domain-containing protein [Thamnocephalis sphaerospora]|eukprot:RKP04511.1 Sec63 Brl domain-containing protein [Thamnocephalis sphaerospora]
MKGRAGRPQFDNSGIARIFVQDSKKNFYKKFLHEPFPVESSLHLHLTDHLNAEIVQGALRTKQDIMDYLSWTYLFRRLGLNPTYYGLEDPSAAGVSRFLSRLIDDALEELRRSGCVDTDVDTSANEPGVGDRTLCATALGRIASYYYLQHGTIRIFRERLTPDTGMAQLLRLLCDATEYSELPVRHNEDQMNQELERDLPLKLNGRNEYDSPHAKAFLLLQAHFSHAELPIADYVTDTGSVLDQSVRILQAMIDVAAELGYLAVCLRTMHLVQCIKQARWWDDSTLRCVPALDHSATALEQLAKRAVGSLAQLVELPASALHKKLKGIRDLEPNVEQQIERVLEALPLMNVHLDVAGDGPTLLGSTVQVRATLDRKFYTHGATDTADLRRQYDGSAHTPHFPKRQYESWWLLLGDPRSDDVMALKRISFQQSDDRPSSTGERVQRRAIGTKLSSTLRCEAPDVAGEHPLTLFIVSDCYLGLDQQLDVPIVVQA